MAARVPLVAVAPDIAAYAAFLQEAVKERDFLTFQPWRLARAENDFIWQHRVIHAAARRFEQDPVNVAGDLQRTLVARRRHNEQRYATRVPALAAAAYTHLKRRITRRVVLPLMERYSVPRLPGFAAADPLSGLTARRPGTRPRASIVVLSFNRESYLRTTIAALHAVTPRDDFELIVVDNASTDGSRDLLRTLAARGVVDKVLFSRENRGTAAGLNVGFAYADPASDYLIKLDSDVAVRTPGWLARFDAFFRAVPDAGLLALGITNHLELRLAPTCRVAGETVISFNSWIVGSGAMTIPRTLFERLGYFSEESRGIKYVRDDADYAARVSLLGLRSFYLRDARAYHREDLDDRLVQVQRMKHDELPATHAAWRVLCDEYLSGRRPLHVWYPRYRHCVFPAGERMLDLP